MPSSELKQNKQALRQHLLAVRQAQSEVEQAAKSRRIRQHLETLPFYKNALLVMYYVAAHGEASLNPLIQGSLEQKMVLLPRTNLETKMIEPYELRKWEDLRPAPFGLSEPPQDQWLPPEFLELVLVPGVAFDRAGNRLGHGYGYYDRFLKGTHAVRVGIAYQFQIVDKVPVGPWDQEMDVVVTEEGVLS